VVSLTDELLDQLGEEYDMKKTEEILTGVYENDTFYLFVVRKMKELAS
jgi:hypothetical protein